MPDRQFNLFLGLGTVAATIIGVAFIVALMGSKAGEIAAALGTVVGGSFALGAAVLVWKGVQDQIAARQTSEKDDERRRMLNLFGSEGPRA